MSSMKEASEKPCSMKARSKDVTSQSSVTSWHWIQRGATLAIYASIGD